MLAVGFYLSGSRAGHQISWAHVVPGSAPWAMLGPGIVPMATMPPVRISALAGRQQYLNVQSLVGQRFPFGLFEPILAHTESVDAGACLIRVRATGCTACIIPLGTGPKCTRNTDWKLAWCTVDGDRAALAPTDSGEVVTVIRLATSHLIAGRPPVVLVGRQGEVLRTARSVQEAFLRASGIDGETTAVGG